MSHWVRLWDDMPTDPKWRSIARRAQCSISEVIAVFNFMMINAANASNGDANANERGELYGWVDDDVAAALDLQTEDVMSIRDAMQGKVLDGLKLKGWEKRQPLREDNSAERAKAWRERNKAQRELKRTQTNAPDRERDSDSDSDSERKKERESRAHPRANPLPQKLKSSFLENDEPTETQRADASQKGLAEEEAFWEEWTKFSNHHLAKGSQFADWDAAWRRWLEGMDKFGGHSKPNGQTNGHMDGGYRLSKLVGAKRFFVGDFAPAYDGQDPKRWQKLTAEDCA
jgi:hypothetical protein